MLFARDCTISDDAQVARVVPNTVRKNIIYAERTVVVINTCPPTITFRELSSNYQVVNRTGIWNNVTQWSLLITVTEVVVSATCDRPLQASVGVSVI